MTVAPRRIGTKKQTKEQGKQHPFALAHQPLLPSIEEHLGTSLLKGVDTGTLTLRLPSTAKGPQHSPELILEGEDEDARPTEFQSWEVATLALDPKLALDFLLWLPNDPPHGVAFGSSLRFWAEAARFSFELITRQYFVPAMQEAQRDGATVYRAGWEVVLAGEDEERLHLLSTAMPPVCLAFL